MNNCGSTLAKIVAFVGGAFAGALLNEWLDKLMVARTQEKSEYDSSRYAQGLKPHSRPPSGEEYQK